MICVTNAPKKHTPLPHPTPWANIFLKLQPMAPLVQHFATHTTPACAPHALNGLRLSLLLLRP